MKRTGKNLATLLEVQQRIKKGETITIITEEYPQYIKNNIPSVNISPIYNVIDENFNGLHKKVERKIIGYKIHG